MRITCEDGTNRLAMEAGSNLRLTSVPGEAEYRAHLLEATKVGPDGVAYIDNPRARTTVTLAAVRVADGNVATHIPFMEPEAGTLPLGLPAEQPSKIGFFVGYSGPLAVRAALRLGYYPGLHMLTHVDSGGVAELTADVAGLRPYELDEQEWAGQIGLWNKLYFREGQTRGLFSWVHHERGSNKLQQQRIVVLPEEMTDLAPGPDVGAGGSSMQVLAYTPDELPSLSQEPISRYADLKIGAGPSFDVNAPVTAGAELRHLLGAFNVAVVPR
jgi:hypothetical protein